MLKETRDQLVTAITDAGIRSADYIAETITPPIAVVVPADPYVVYPRAGRDDVPFGHVVVRFDVFLIVTPSSNRQASDAVDELIEQVLAAIDDYDVESVSEPAEVTYSGDRFVGSIIRVSATERRPT